MQFHHSVDLLLVSKRRLLSTEFLQPSNKIKISDISDV